MGNKRWPWMLGGAAVIAAASYLALRGPTPEPPPQVAQPAPAPAKPADAPLPSAEKSDAQVRKDLGSLSSQPEWAKWLSASDLLDRFVAIVDNVAEDVNPRKQLDFVQLNPQKSARLDTARYDRIADVVASVDAKGAAQVVRDLHPLLESAYHRLGYPDRSFDQVAAKALQRIVDAPVVEKPPRLVPKGLVYGFADEKLEALRPVEKLMLRMGPRNTKLIQAKAREIAAALDLRVATH
jgi:Protein of unknown function (DUF3014)